MEDLKYTNGGTMAYEVSVTSDMVTESEVAVDFGTLYDMVATVQARSSVGTDISLTGSVITYPEVGQVSITAPTATAYTLANSLKTVTNAHAADATEHTNADDVNYAITTPDASDISSLITLTTDLMVAYVAHNADSILASGWAFHVAQGTTHPLASEVAPTTLSECVTRLNDLKAKYTLHDADSTSHTTGGTHAETTDDASSTFALSAGDKVTMVAFRKRS